MKERELLFAGHVVLEEIGHVQQKFHVDRAIRRWILEHGEVVRVAVDGLLRVRERPGRGVEGEFEGPGEEQELNGLKERVDVAVGTGGS